MYGGTGPVYVIVKLPPSYVMIRHLLELPSKHDHVLPQVRVLMVLKQSFSTEPTHVCAYTLVRSIAVERLPQSHPPCAVVPQRHHHPSLLHRLPDLQVRGSPLCPRLIVKAAATTSNDRAFV
jgi:hypothetical protein